jgi:hypothetical protein
VWWLMPTIPALRNLRLEDREFETSLGYKARLCLKKQVILVLILEMTHFQSIESIFLS